MTLIQPFARADASSWSSQLLSKAIKVGVIGDPETDLSLLYVPFLTFPFSFFPLPVFPCTTNSYPLPSPAPQFSSRVPPCISTLSKPPT